MTMCQIEVPAADRLKSPAARLFQRLANWQEERHQRKATAAALSDLPAHLRHDIGIDGGAPLRPARGSGRSFDHTRDPDRKVIQWEL